MYGIYWKRNFPDRKKKKIQGSEITCLRDCSGSVWNTVGREQKDIEQSWRDHRRGRTQGNLRAKNVFGFVFEHNRKPEKGVQF